MDAVDTTMGTFLPLLCLAAVPDGSGAIEITLNVARITIIVVLLTVILAKVVSILVV